MGPKKTSSSAPLPKGQASLSSFFGGRNGNSSSGAAAAAVGLDGSSPASSPKATTPSPTKAKSAIAQPTNGNPKQTAAPSDTKPTSSKYFAAGTKRQPSRAAATKADPLVIDDDDDDDFQEPRPAPSKSRTAAATSSRSPRRSTPAKRKAAVYDGSSDDQDDDDDDDKDAYQPPSKKTTSSSRTAKRAIDTESDDDDLFVSSTKSTPAHKKAASASKPQAAAASSRAKQPAASSAKKVDMDLDDVKSESAAAADKKPSWREMAARRAAGPSAPGSKEIPHGEPNCLAGLTLVFTGELSSISREEATDLAKRYGARITSAPSSKTSYVVLGEGAGPKKVESIKKNKIPTLDEDGFLDLIRSRGAGEIDEKTKQKMREEEKKIQEVAKSMGPPKGADVDPSAFANMLWTTKYAPKQMKDLVGNKAAVEKLAGWLKAWPNSYRSNFKKPGPTGMNVYRAVLISGPPGIGKTTSAHLVAKMEGFSPLEFNASDTRSKKLIESMLQDTINNKSLDSWYSGGKMSTGTGGADGVRIHDRTVLIMDEVDGMSGGDRGGVGAINALIKKTKVPIICICNDRRSQKMRPFEHTTYNLGFRKPDAAQVRSRMLSIAFKEKLKVNGEVMAQLIEASQGDIRSVINMLSTWKLSKSEMTFDESKALGAENAKPGLATPFTLYSELSSPYMFSQTSRKTLNDKANLYFQDHAFVPLMVAENYVKARPVLASREPNERLRSYKHLELLRRAAESISDGDMVDRMIHGSEQHWSLMPLHAIASSVRPCSYIYGGTEGGFPSFPAWLGQNSKQQRLSRAVVDLQAKMRLVCSGSRHDLRQHYLPSMWSLLIDPLVKRGAEGVEDVIELMDDYYLGMEDREAILELGIDPHNAEALAKSIPSAVKAGLTRKYNASNHPIAFNKSTDLSSAKTKIAKQDAPDLEDVVEEEQELPPDDDDDDDGKDDDLAKDKLVKKPKASSSTAAAKGKAKAKVARGKAK
ncbi:DNA replication factor C, large subunit [Testicularia cyperi]|uniref:Replication factor C subunit 1 n=1 Tax=Testicularia cyperi TaxID=1882483 RepID=A0A317XIN5_9BASI|nr:DNA replication factor C, large subunit [Testicularia cyperi]